MVTCCNVAVVLARVQMPRCALLAFPAGVGLPVAAAALAFSFPYRKDCRSAAVDCKERGPFQKTFPGQPMYTSVHVPSRMPLSSLLCKGKSTVLMRRRERRIFRSSTWRQTGGRAKRHRARRMDGRHGVTWNSERHKCPHAYPQACRNRKTHHHAAGSSLSEPRSDGQRRAIRESYE